MFEEIVAERERANDSIQMKQWITFSSHRAKHWVPFCISLFSGSSMSRTQCSREHSLLQSWLENQWHHMIACFPWKKFHLQYPLGKRTVKSALQERTTHLKLRVLEKKLACSIFYSRETRII